MVSVLINPGHGGNDPGAIGNGLKEKEVNLKIAKKVKSILEGYENIKVYMSRENDKTMSLKEITDMANKLNVDYFLSIHINAGGGTGFESFIHDSLATGGQTDKMRNILHTEVIKRIDMRDRGKKKANFHVLRETKMPAVLTENGFIDHADDAKKLKDNKFLDKVAEGHALGIVKMFNLKKKSSPKPQPKPPEKDNVNYRVVAGSFKEKKNAEQRVKELKAKGFDSFIVAYEE